MLVENSVNDVIDEVLIFKNWLKLGPENACSHLCASQDKACNKTLMCDTICITIQYTRYDMNDMIHTPYSFWNQ